MERLGEKLRERFEDGFKKPLKRLSTPCEAPH
jgi:hypothetical protein